MRVCSKNNEVTCIEVLHVQLVDLGQSSLPHLHGAIQIHEAMASMISLCDPNTFTTY